MKPSHMTALILTLACGYAPTDQKALTDDDALAQPATPTTGETAVGTVPTPTTAQAGDDTNPLAVLGVTFPAPGKAEAVDDLTIAYEEEDYTLVVTYNFALTDAMVTQQMSTDAPNWVSPDFTGFSIL